ncbi:MAG: hypothetical protein ACOC1W_02660 [Bacillota bacterium]
MVNLINFKKTGIVFLVIVTGLILMAGPVQAVREISGDELEITTLEDDQYIFEARGNAQLMIDELEINGDLGEFHSIEQEVRFYDNVVVNGPDLKIEAGEFLYELENERAILQGRPRVQYAELDATSDEVEYLMADEMLYMRGSVEGKRGQQQFSSDEVEVDLAGDKIKLSGQARMELPEGELE